jgi:hypothetical protein
VSDELVIKIPHKPGFRCPNCGGLGRMQDGRLSIGPEEIRVKLGTVCGVCRGLGRVRVLPLTDEHGLLEADPPATGKAE